MKYNFLSPVYIIAFCFIACGRKTAGIDEQAVKINSIPCGFSDNKLTTDSMFSYEGIKTGNKKQTGLKNKTNIQ